MSRELIALLDARAIGRVVRGAQGRLTFTYSDE